jgi:Zn-finger nucleic acid-binding protein
MVMNTPDDITNEFLHAGKSKYKCPVCKTIMRKRSFLFPERLVVGICPEEHGVYFEKGELEQVFKIKK